MPAFLLFTKVLEFKNCFLLLVVACGKVGAILLVLLPLFHNGGDAVPNSTLTVLAHACEQRFCFCCMCDSKLCHWQSWEVSSYGRWPSPS